ncbi:matE domain-containing protein [Ditylenchus destructor]|uniref:MatE domain-containing protein n=1 Tax=Ditylenchus destructor TaxID=166010 RepID=A0AAD4MI90_9BILA|nr:matE domain-containing protein [Ditylenchus destructor]
MLFPTTFARRRAESSRWLARGADRAHWTIMHVTDVIVVGLVSTHEVAALGASRTLTFIGIVVALGWLTGVLVFSSRADGAKDLPATGAVRRQGLVLGFLLGLISGGTLFAFALPMLQALASIPRSRPRPRASSASWRSAIRSSCCWSPRPSSSKGQPPKRVMVVDVAILRSTACSLGSWPPASSACRQWAPWAPPRPP